MFVLVVGALVIFVIAVSTRNPVDKPPRKFGETLMVEQCDGAPAQFSYDSHRAEWVFQCQGENFLRRVDSSVQP
jgi:hypothetical protein